MSDNVLVHDTEYLTHTSLTETFPDLDAGHAVCRVIADQIVDVSLLDALRVTGLEIQLQLTA